MKESFNPQRGRSPQVENLCSRDSPDHVLCSTSFKGVKGRKSSQAQLAAGTDCANSEDALTQRSTEWTPGIEAHFVLGAGGLKWLW